MDGVVLDAALVRRLVSTQFPQWSALPVTPVLPGGWDNRTFRLGDELSVRLPSAPGYAAAVAKEQRWLPRLAPQLPVPIPEPVAAGEPTAEYPLPWSVYRWRAGTPLADSRGVDQVAFARDLAAFLTALRSIDATDGPAAGEHSFLRGLHPSVYDDDLQRSRRALAGRIRDDVVAAIWAEAAESTWSGSPVWFHGDVAPGNLLVDDGRLDAGGRLAAVIDFGTSGVGDPACDTVLAWTWFDEPARTVFHDALALDDATWTRGRAWALWKALLVLEQSRVPAARAEAQHVLDALGV